MTAALDLDIDTILEVIANSSNLVLEPTYHWSTSHGIGLWCSWCCIWQSGANSLSVG